MSQPTRDPPLDHPDPVPLDLHVFHQRFVSVAEEMGEVLMRTAFSPNIKERRDFSCAVFDAQGRLVAQAAHIPVHLGAMPLDEFISLVRENIGRKDSTTELLRR